MKVIKSILYSALISLVFAVLFTACTSYSCPTYAQKNVRFDYFRVIAKGKKMVTIDVDGLIFINRSYLVIKSNDFGRLDDRYDFEYKIKIKGRSAWNAHPYGLPQEHIYIEYKKGEYITILFIKKSFVVYFISSDLKSRFEPLPKPGILYENFN